MNTFLVLVVALSVFPVVAARFIDDFTLPDDKYLFTSIVVKDTSSLSEDVVTFFSDNSSSLFEVRKVGSSASAAFLADETTAQVYNEKPWTPMQAVRISPGATDDTVLTFYVVKRVTAAFQNVRAVIRIEDKEGNKETRRYNISEFNAICPLNEHRTHNVCTDTGNQIIRLPSFRLPRYEDLPSWARNRDLISLSFSLEECQYARKCRKEKKILSAHLRLSTDADDVDE